MKNGNIQFFFQSFLDGKTFGRADVFEVDAPERGRDHFHRLYDVVFVLSRKDDGNAVDICKLLEKKALALHHGESRKSSDVPEPQNGAPVGNDGDGIPFAGIRVSCGGVFCDRFAGRGTTRRIRIGERFAVFDFHKGLHREFPAQFRMHGK